LGQDVLKLADLLLDEERKTKDDQKPREPLRSYMPSLWTVVLDMELHFRQSSFVVSTCQAMSNCQLWLWLSCVDDSKSANQQIFQSFLLDLARFVTVIRARV
jgi:hypothetical protein